MPGYVLWPPPFPWLTITVRCWLRFLGRPPMKNLLTKGVVCQKFGEIWFYFRERHATLRLMGGCCSQGGNPLEFFLGKEIPKTIFKLRC